jgi:two-component system sensor histidine kinase CpxA
LVPQQIELSHLVSEVVEDARMEASANDKGVAWHADAQATVMGSPELLRSAIENVLRNAVRFTDKETQVEVDLQVRPTAAVLTIRDHGQGVPPAELDRIFEPFYRVPESSDRGSTGGGLGLTITARVIVLHGGTVKARNAQGSDPSTGKPAGLIVEINLPLTPLKNAA